MRQSLIFIPNFFGSWIQSCTKLVGTHALIIIITFRNQDVCVQNDMYDSISHVLSMRPSPSLPHQAMLVYTCLSFIPSALSSTTLILGERGTEFLYKMSQQFRTRLK